MVPSHLRGRRLTPRADTESMMKKLAVAAMAGTVVLGAGAGAMAWADSGSPSAPSASASATAPGAQGGRARAKGGMGARALLRRAEHGDLTVKTENGFQDVTFDRGRVTAASATS